MAFQVKWTRRAAEDYKALEAQARAARENRLKDKKRTKSSKQEGLFKQVAKTVQLLQGNPRHSGLKSHKYDSIPHPFEPNQPVFEAYVQNKTPGAYRLFWCYGPGKGFITIIAITPHP